MRKSLRHWCELIGPDELLSQLMSFSVGACSPDFYKSLTCGLCYCSWARRQNRRPKPIISPSTRGIAFGLIYPQLTFEATDQRCPRICIPTPEETQNRCRFRLVLGPLSSESMFKDTHCLGLSAAAEWWNALLQHAFEDTGRLSPSILIIFLR